MAVTGVNTPKGLPLTTWVAVLFDTPSLYTTVKGPVPAVAVQVSIPAPDPQKGPLAVRLPWGVCADNMSGKISTSTKKEANTSGLELRNAFFISKDWVN